MGSSLCTTFPGLKAPSSKLFLSSVHGSNCNGALHKFPYVGYFGENCSQKLLKITVKNQRYFRTM